MVRKIRAESFFLVFRRPPRYPLFPYTTLFRSVRGPRTGPRVTSGASPQVMPIHASARRRRRTTRSEEHTSELQSPDHIVCRLLLEKKNRNNNQLGYLDRQLGSRDAQGHLDPHE